MIVRPLCMSDVPSLIGWFSNARDLALWGSPARKFPLDKPQLARFLAETGGERPRQRLWAGELDDRLAAIAATTLDWDQGVALLGLVGIAPDMRGRRLAVPFLQDVVDATFALDAIDRIELNVYTINSAAIRTYERLGFVREGIRRSLARFDSERWDAVHYAMLRPEWESRRGKSFKNATHAAESSIMS